MSDSNPPEKKTKTTTVNCPTCNTLVEWTETAKWRPFCSDRCKLIDLGEWASESYSLHGEGKNDFNATPKEED